MSKTGTSDSALCECSDCNTAFCRAKKMHAKGISCKYCQNYSHEASVLYFSEDPINNTTGVTGTDTSASVIKPYYSEYLKEYCKMDLDDIELTNNMDSKPHTNVEMNSFEEDADMTQTSYEDDKQSCVNPAYSRKQMSTTTAQLSAQIMNLPYKDFKESISHEQIETYKLHDILKKLKEAYDACTCKICECIVGKPNRSQSCDCKPCECKDCVSFRRDDVLDKVKKTSCSCQPCECINCAKLNEPAPCDCEPCQCIVCKGTAVQRDKMVIVAPVRQGSQRVNCLCAPCDCPRCRQRSLNLSLSRVHEMSTGINRHPNCRCEVCMDDSCEPNGTETCRCQVRHGVIRKPVEKNPHDFDIRRTMVLNNPIKTCKENGRNHTVSMYSALEKNKYSSYNRNKVTTSECNCSICECIDCDYKNDFNSKTLLDKSLRTLKLPTTDFKNCNCSTCECLHCISKKYEHCTGSGQLKGCSCEICDCLYCEGAPKPGNALSSIIPVAEMSSYKIEPAVGPALDERNDCWKSESHGDVCHCKICQCIQCTDKGDASEEGLYPIKKGELLTPSRMRTDPISELDLPSQSSEYTQLKHSKGQSNVFKRESKASEETKREFIVLHLVPRQRTKHLLPEPTTPCNSNLVGDELGSSNNILRVELPKDNTVTYMTQRHCTSTSKTLFADVIVKSIDNVCSYRKSKIKSAETACFNDSTQENKGLEYENSPPMSASLSKHSFQNVSPSISVSNKNSTSQRSLLIKNVESVTEPSELKKETSSKEVKLASCSSEEQSGGALHDCYGRQALLHKTYVYSALSSNNFNNVEENSDVLEETSFNKDTLENRCYWKLSQSTIDLELSNSEMYKTALTTLEKSKNFSLQLVKLLEQYERANSEFESISKKLKQSHDSVFNNFDLCIRTCKRINNKIKDVGFVDLAQNYKSKTVEYSSMTALKNNSSLSLIREISDTSSEETSSKIKIPTDILEFNCSQADKASAEICERSKKNDIRIYPMTENYNSSTTDISLVDGVFVKNDSLLLKNHIRGCKKVKYSASFAKDLIQWNTADKDTKHFASLLGASDLMYNARAKIKQIQNTLKEYLIDRYLDMELFQLGAPRSIMKIEKASLETTPKEEPSTPSSIVKDKEKNSSQNLSEIDRRSHSCNTRTLETISYKWPASRIILRVISNLEAAEPETKLKEEPSPKAYIINNQEKSKSIENLPDIGRRSSSYCNTQALEKLANGVKDLLKAHPALEQPPKKYSTSYIRNIRKPITVKKEWHFAKPLTVASEGLNKECNAKSTAKEPTRNDSEKKVKFTSLRRVSDHSVLVKWETPVCVKDVKGYEILVDGRAAQKIFSPARCMAVVTCLPRSEQVLLTIRTLTDDRSNEKLPSTTISYRPRAKHARL